MPFKKKPYINITKEIIIFISMIIICLFSYGINNSFSMNPPNKKINEEPVKFSAETISNDNKKQIVTAIGNVELLQGKQILRADKVTYFLSQDKVKAEGNVSLLDKDGNIFFADNLELKNKMKDGFINELLSLLADGSRFTAKKIKRENGGSLTTMTEATYTACKVCESDPHPLWQIKASEITHNTKDKSVHYKNARLELLGVPLLYSPVFSHPDPSVKRKTGFLRPSYGWTKSLGANISTGFYYDIAPNKDLTLKVTPTSLAGTLFSAEWRQGFKNGTWETTVTTAVSDRKKENGTIKQGAQRGHISTKALFDINNKWRSGFNITRTSDKQYLRLYDIIDQDVFNNEVYAERFSGRNYSRISALNFQDVRLGTRPDQPNVLPMIEHTIISEPNALLKGRWKAEFSALGLVRSKNNGQDVYRSSLELDWERRSVNFLGFLNIVNLNGRSDLYYINDSDIAKTDPTKSNSLTTGRSMATLSLTTSYPLIKPLSQKVKSIIEPIVELNLSPKINKRDNSKIPNEDSIDIRFDSSNLFDKNRYSGVDRQEDGGRINFGLKTGIYSNDGKYAKLLIGQTYRFYGRNPFPKGSGLENKLSDFVGEAKIGLAENLYGDYRFQFDNSTLKAKRHEAQLGGGTDLFQLDSRYIYTSSVAGTGFTQAREQLQVDGTYNLNKHWQVTSSSLIDIGDQPGLRSAVTGFNYADECFTFSIQGTRKVAKVASGQNDTRLMMRIGFKHIGDFKGREIGLEKNHQR